MYKYLCTIVSILFFISCHHNRKHIAADKLVKANYLSQYNFEKPDVTIELPKELKEISGISFLNDSVIAVISDGKPYLYFYNIYQQEIINKIEVASGSDFEDVTVCGDTAFILQSNGKLWVIANYNKIPVITSVILPLKAPFELEGLCHNYTKDTLFIAAKYWHEEEIFTINELPVWAFSTKQMRLIEKPLFYISTAIASGEKNHLFHTSGFMLVGSPTCWIFISTNKKYITQLDYGGIKDSIISLESDEFTQPEGIDMNSVGTIYISNEGKDDKATLLQFNRKQK